ncbi:hypothetical protein SAMN05518672_107107 [Chitinophaga sp. CF118]|uniref:hypothetical protein n=1 Tax=Chitinophaga sp. CF118 TaxID=1884367 RepID=UPI0008F07F3E|nr:hypothetical protein [Chitinophaga sp. CF118]SFE52921.1 hypothetical protein SAMN05518672_107107 [Chitinophaga sp. CF118]
MRMQTKDFGNKAITLRLAIYKGCITACLAIIISIFLFACGGAKESGSTTDTTAVMQTTPSEVAPADTASMPADTTSTKPDSIPVH